MKNKITFSYAKLAFALALPTMIQQFITAFGNLVDNLMIGVNGKDAINAVGASGQIFFVVMLIGFGVSAGVGVFIAQQYGSQKYEQMHYTFLIGIISVVAIGVVSAVVVYTFKGTFIGFFTKVESQHILSYDYLKIIVFTYPIFLISIVIAGAYRSCGNTIVPMIAGVIAIVINTTLNFLLINGNFGAPALGVQGAAIATLVARCIELLILIIIMERKHMPFRPKILDVFKIPFSLVVKIYKKALPLMMNEFLWGFGTVIIMGFYGSRNADDYTSVQMAYTTANLLFVVMSGFATAVGILVGQELGRQKLIEAKKHSEMLIQLALLTGLIVVGLAFILSFITPNLYNVSDEIRNNSANILRVIALFFPVYMILVTFFFVLRAGGDTTGVLIMDSLIMWICSIPLIFILTTYTAIPLILIFILVQCVDFIKLIAAVIIYRKYEWLKTLV